MPDHLSVFPLGMSSEIGSSGRLSGTCAIAMTFPVEAYTETSIGIPEDTVPSMQLITLEPTDTVTQLPVSSLPASDRTFTTLVLTNFVVTSAAFMALWSSTVSFSCSRLTSLEL